MNWIRKTVAFIGLSIVFLFAFSANGSPIDPIQLEKSSSSFSTDSIHSSVFIQPQAISIFSLHHKTTGYTIANILKIF